ncbi:MAG: amino acid ABC transporter substrate-binding protein [Desulfobacterales bacterium]|nr:amino acid ABC transporter substrate-binding protein [Desulfobacterales bacterium]
MTIRILVFICLVMCVSISQCFADSLKVATLDYPPFQYKVNGKAKGIAADIVKEVFNRMNQPIEIRFYPFPRAIKYIEEGFSDVIFTFYSNIENHALRVWSEFGGFAV